MRHFVVYPSADPTLGIDKMAPIWRERGYEVMVGLDADKMCAQRTDGPHLVCLPAPWSGYYGDNGVNVLAREAFKLGADLCTFIGDDMIPPLQGAQHHAELYFKRFPDGYGIMQCTGDRQGDEMGGTRNAERICGSPTFGRGWHEKSFSGSGGFPVGFHAFYGDEILKEVSERLGLLYQEPALNIEHLHWSWNRSPKRWWHEDNANRYWGKDRAQFDAAKENDFAHYLAQFPK